MHTTILISGYRNYTDYDAFKSVLDKHTKDIKQPIKIIHGGATGADALAGRYATEYKHDVQVFPADWRKHGNAAGPIRNAEMLQQKPDVCVMFMHADSKGTKNMLKLCKAHKKMYPNFQWVVVDI